ncbi:hypothetical protein M9Y10_039495 [Tritrichomonas musculus]|uniref:non-specific serine/threonine protein kinase n=1 Tax=Tritrichomonas musculus TaxID=1915356 RepID=A0ABR2KEK1_9EUKA
MNFQEIQNIFDQKLFHISNPFLNKIIQKFKFLLISEDYQTSIQNLRITNKYNIVVIGDHINSQNECNIPNFFIVCFDYTLLLIPSTDFSLLFSFFEINPESTIYCTSGNVKKKIEQSGNQRIHFHFSEENDRLLIEKLTSSFLTKYELDFSNVTSEAIKTIKFAWNLISKSVSFFMIKIGFLNSKYDRNIHFDDYLKSGVEDKELMSDEFIELNLYNRGSSSSIYLAYLIEKEEICLMKMFVKTLEEEKLFQREHENYLSIKHPLHPRYFGTTKYLSYNCLFIEYLEGRTLNEIDFEKESNKNIMKIIFEIMIILSYLHHNGFVYRDLKPNNVIVDKNYTVYLIDFNRMIKSSSLISNQNMTDNFCDGYIAPEILNGESFTYKSDIYSLGKVILFILLKNNSQELINIQQMFSKCISSKENERPSLSQLIKAFHIEFFFVVFMIDNILTEINYESDISTFYLFMIAEYQNANTQFRLAFFYLNGHALSIYFNYKTVPEYIKKGIYLITLSAINGCITSSFHVGYFNHKGVYMKRDINKAIHYYKEASSFNNQYAKNNLGIIFKKGYKDEVAKNLGLSIEYFKEAIRQKNDKISMYNLAHLYFYEDPIKDSIDKSIELLMRSLENGFQPSKKLLCIALIKKCNFDLYAIKEEIERISHGNKELSFEIYTAILNSKLLDSECFVINYEYYRDIDFLYQNNLKPFLSIIIEYDSEMISNSVSKPKIPNISKLFYEGFGFEI